MARQGTSTPVEPGILEYANGFRVFVKRGNRQVDRFRSKPITLPELRYLLAEITQELEASIPIPGSLRADVDTFIATLASPTRRKDAKRELGRWINVFGDRPRDTITSVEIDTQLATWGQEPASSRKHLRQILGQLYRKLNGKSGRNPVAETTPIREVYDEPRALPYPLIDLIFAQMADRKPAKKGTEGAWNKTKLRLRVMAYTGLTQAMLGRLQARDIDLVAKTMHVRPRRKGAGTAYRTLRLLEPAVAAFRALEEAQGFGRFGARSMAHSWRRAVRKAQKAWKAATPAPWPAPDNVRAYDLRHAFGTHAYAQTGDSAAVAELLLHATLDQTKRYTQAAVSARNDAAIAAMALGLTVVPPPPPKRGPRLVAFRKGAS